MRRRLWKARKNVEMIKQNERYLIEFIAFWYILCTDQRIKLLQTWIDCIVANMQYSNLLRGFGWIWIKFEVLLIEIWKKKPKKSHKNESEGTNNYKWHMFECVEVLIGIAFLQKKLWLECASEYLICCLLFCGYI